MNYVFLILFHSYHSLPYTKELVFNQESIAFGISWLKVILVYIELARVIGNILVFIL